MTTQRGRVAFAVVLTLLLALGALPTAQAGGGGADAPAPSLTTNEEPGGYGPPLVPIASGPLTASALLLAPKAMWLTDGQVPIGLPVGARLRVETGDQRSLLVISPGADGLTARAGTPIDTPAPIRLRLRAPADAALHVDSSRLTLTLVNGETVHRPTILLPTINLPAGGEMVFWLTDTGASFYGAVDETSINRSHLARDTNQPWELQPGYRIDAVDAALHLPTSLAFVPNPGTDPAAPRLYVTELYGRIKVITNDGRQFSFAENLLNFSIVPAFPGQGENGVIGVCLSPTSRDVYATTVYRNSANSMRNKMIRVRSKDGLVADSVEDLLVVKPGQGLARASHQIQQCSFGPDGKLYVYVGDGPVPAAAQDDASFGGKLLRLNPDGSAPTDNPRYDKTKPTAPISYQYTKGQRNAFGMAWRPSTNQLYLSENGPITDRMVHVVPGMNYGWNGTDESMRTNALYVWPGTHWSPTGLSFADGVALNALGPARAGHLFVGSSGQVYFSGPQRAGKHIQEFVLAPDGSIAGEPTTFVRYIGEGKGTVIDVKVQPDGLYFTDLYLDDGDGGPIATGGKLWRVSYVGAVNFSASATHGAAPLSVTFSDISSLPADQARAWDFGDGTGSGEANPSHTFDRPGQYVVRLSRQTLDGRTTDQLTLVTVTEPDGAVPAATGTARLDALAAPQVIYFPETGRVLGGGFKYFWDHNGGLTTFGYPITGEFSEVNPEDGQEYTIQYFERARFEYHPEHKETPYETQLGLIGRQVASRRLHEPPFQRLVGGAAESTPDRPVFAETGHSLSGAFLARWQATGGVDIYGLPISEPIREPVEPFGAPMVVQFFERAVMVAYPEYAGTVDEVRLNRIGTIVFNRRPPPRLP